MTINFNGAINPNAGSGQLGSSQQGVSLDTIMSRANNVTTPRSALATTQAYNLSGATSMADVRAWQQEQVRTSGPRSL